MTVISREPLGVHSIYIIPKNCNLPQDFETIIDTESVIRESPPRGPAVLAAVGWLM
jgi:hypothetical protein